MPLILEHPNANAYWGAPKNWNAELNGPCATLPTITNGELNIMHITFTPDELATLNKGGSFQFSLHQPAMPVVSLAVVEWPDHRYDENGEAYLPKDDRERQLARAIYSMTDGEWEPTIAQAYELANIFR